MTTSHFLQLLSSLLEVGHWLLVLAVVVFGLRQITLNHVNHVSLLPRRRPHGFPIGTRRAAVITAMHSSEKEPLAMRVQKAASAERKDCLQRVLSIFQMRASHASPTVHRWNRDGTLSACVHCLMMRSLIVPECSLSQTVRPPVGASAFPQVCPL